MDEYIVRQIAVIELSSLCISEFSRIKRLLDNSRVPLRGVELWPISQTRLAGYVYGNDTQR
jgi:hypothetical protein